MPPNTLRRLTDLAEIEDLPPDVTDAVELQKRFGTLSEEEKELLDTARRLPPEALRQLKEFTKNEDFVSRLAELDDFKNLQKSPKELENIISDLDKYRSTGRSPDEIESLSEKIEQLSKFEDLGKSPEEIAEIIENYGEFESTGMTPGEIENMAGQLKDLDTIRDIAANTNAEIADKIREKAGPLIDDLNGEVLDNGNVIFEDEGLFSIRSAKINDRFDKVLEKFCGVWFGILYDEDQSLRNVQIEGHASSEWKGAETPEEAFEQNLNLSQERAAAVFNQCLKYIKNKKITEWARKKMAAIGFSSSRPVLNADGSENKKKSRRVVFALTTRFEEAVVEVLFGKGGKIPN